MLKTYFISGLMLFLVAVLYFGGHSNNQQTSDSLLMKLSSQSLNSFQKFQILIDISGIDINDAVSITVIGMNGETLIRKALTGNQKQQVSVSHLKPGIYFVKVQTGASVQNLRFIKL